MALTAMYLGLMRAEQHAALVAGADDAHAERLGDGLP